MSARKRQRFLDRGESLSDFLWRILVHCPKCDSCALLTTRPARLVCTHCGYVKRGAWWGALGGPKSFDGALSLWLQTPCCGETLWAFNHQHVRFLQTLVSAQLRERKYLLHGGDNGSLASRLPPWMTSAKHRTAVARALQQLADQSTF